MPSASQPPTSTEATNPSRPGLGPSSDRIPSSNRKRSRRAERASRPTAREHLAPAVRLFDRYLESAVEAGASDLHLEPAGDTLQIRARIDGRLRVLGAPPSALAGPLMTRIRLLARVDLAEHRLPQDGRFSATTGDNRRVDIRASFLPVRGGEKAVLRLLRRDAAGTRLDHTGLTGADLHAVTTALGRADGLILVAGPTGSGKTTTLYAALGELTSTDRAISTVEDPVEREFEGVAQVSVDEEIGRSFSVALRALLRQDPDVLMIGEVRDRDSAAIACRAALTGHLVLTSVHAGDCREALLRLHDLEVPDYITRATVRLILSQRLLRLLCPNCRNETISTAASRRVFEEAGLEAGPVIWGADGCRDCGHTGYCGRTAVFELLQPDGLLQPGGPGSSRQNESGILSQASVSDDTQAVAANNTPLKSSAANNKVAGDSIPGSSLLTESLLTNGLRLAAAGYTTVEEVLAKCPVGAPARVLPRGGFR